MTQLTDSVFSVEVPDKVENLNLYRVNNYAIMLEWDDVERPLNPYTCVKVDEHYGDLKDYKWPKILCTTKEASEEQAKGIVGSSEWYFPARHTRYIDYAHPYNSKNKQEWSIGFSGARDSLRSLLTSKGLDVKRNYILIKKL